MSTVSNNSFGRVDTILEYIHNNLDATLSVETLADMSCWSRWQFQRVFQNHTGVSVAQYVREQRLGMAALDVLTKEKRMLDIAYAYGFTSEIAFSRAFKQYFKVSPREYQKQGKKVGIKQPFRKREDFEEEFSSRFFSVRLEYKDAFSVVGMSTTIHGLLSDTPDFSQKIPQVWAELDARFSDLQSIPKTKYAVIDTRTDSDVGSASDLRAEGDSLTYLAGLLVDDILASDLKRYADDVEIADVPAQEYAVLPFEGRPQDFFKSVEWLLSEWLPASGHQGVEGFDLEIYQTLESTELDHIQVEYWLPINSA
ncbi:AraC family transcriptional regulator [Vibrio sp. T187]|uniref:AraC family transcriptional regulator n=1 Tax=Vibrio TaxID=662 RepID=UPI0010C9F0E4|nr:MULTISPECIES: AraC family transcriptional regulator [Vibrio]MBW3698318.1 AraC family transcriptional regulator [Vibrio sp. T187]